MWGIAQQADGTAYAKAERAWLELPRLKHVGWGVGDDSGAGKERSFRALWGKGNAMGILDWEAGSFQQPS